jgi:hypothetical protein
MKLKSPIIKFNLYEYENFYFYHFSNLNIDLHNKN